jgi:hypothetical protein
VTLDETERATLLSLATSQVVYHARHGFKVNMGRKEGPPTEICTLPDGRRLASRLHFESQLLVPSLQCSPVMGG